MSSIPCENLLGIKTESGWEVIEMIHKHPGATGGSFSTGYKVKKGNVQAFLKALDYSKAFSLPDPSRKLEELSSAYNFERDLLYKCRDRKLSKVVYPIEDGSVDIPGFLPGTNKVYYIIFELADGDIRKINDKFARIDLAFIFRVLHNSAVGIEQLHKIDIAHQDLKPSNVLVFNNVSKISDIGRASDKNFPFKYDDYNIPGDRNYTPIEQLYQYHFSGDFNEKLSADIYQLGSLFFYFFANISASQAFLAKARVLNISYTGSFKQDLPELERVFNEVMNDMKPILGNVLPKKDAEQVSLLISSLCCPDPSKRGYRNNLESSINQFSLERVISRLDMLAKKAEYKII